MKRKKKRNRRKQCIAELIMLLSEELKRVSEKEVYITIKFKDVEYF